VNRAGGAIGVTTSLSPPPRSTSASTSALALVLASIALMSSTAGCMRLPTDRADPMSAIPREPLGEDRLSLRWKRVLVDRREDMSPQEFATPTLWSDTVYAGSSSGELVAMRASTGELRWRKPIGQINSRPAVDGGLLYAGTEDGVLFCLDAQTGEEKWKYQSRGPIGQMPLVSGNLVVFSNEGDQVIALDSITGAFKWLYKSDTPEENTLRGHAGVAGDGELFFTGFSNGNIVALRRDTGSVAWLQSLKGEASAFFDVDATPVLIDETVYVTSSSGGVYALDKTSGLVRWRTPLWDASMPSASGNVGGLTSDGTFLYVMVADLGIHALDLQGNVVWRVGANKGGEPATPVVAGDLVLYTLAKDGLYLARRRSGAVVEYWDPGDGISASPAVTSDGRMFLISNRGILYAFDLD
jgi:outer membrane protein assembly factor BamB